MPDKFDELTDHDYDGIREYDNPMPGWWVGIFWITVVFSAAYFVWYHAPVEGRSVYDNFDAAYAADLKARFSKMGELNPTEPALAQWMVNADYMKVGTSVFKSNCVSCHGPDGQGLVGPNLTDEKYRNVRSLMDIVTVVRDGANKGAMPAHATKLHKNEIALVSAYVATLRGKNLAGSTYALGEGEVAPPWPKAPASQAATTEAATQEK